MMFAKSTALALAACALVSQPALAQSAKPCVSEAEVSAMVIYGVPHALRGVQDRCGANLAPDGFMAREGNRLTQRYAALAQANWRPALNGLMQLSGAGEMEQDSGFDLASLPPEIVRPLIDEMIAQKVGEQVKVGDCRRIERAVEAFAPLEPAELGRISAVILSLVGVDQFTICPVT